MPSMLGNVSACGIQEPQAVTLTRTLAETSDSLRGIGEIVAGLHTRLRGPEPCAEENCKMQQRETGILELAEQNHKTAEALRIELAGILQRL